jgi:hypothetical protein
MSSTSELNDDRNGESEQHDADDESNRLTLPLRDQQSPADEFDPWQDRNDRTRSPHRCRLGWPP